MSDKTLPTVIDDKPLTVSDIQTQVGVIQQVLKGVMKVGTHYGKIQGCGNDPVLLKPGAEKIAATFRLSVDPEVTDLSSADEYRYRVKVRLISPSGTFVGAGIGEASTNEEKYKWRSAVCNEEYVSSDPGRRREKWKKGYNGNPPEKTQQVRTEPSDLANTVLKMAKKRGLVDAVLTATAASDIFKQDLDDLPDEIRDELVGSDSRNSSPGPGSPKRKSSRSGDNKTQQTGTVNEGQAKLLRAKLTGLKVEESQLLKEFGIDSIEALPASEINNALDWVAGAAQ